jgi:hypothetical protein
MLTTFVSLQKPTAKTNGNRYTVTRNSNIIAMITTGTKVYWETIWSNGLHDELLSWQSYSNIFALNQLSLADLIHASLKLIRNQALTEESNRGLSGV